jgi:hypothetical protein
MLDKGVLYLSWVVLIFSAVSVLLGLGIVILFVNF